MSRRAHKPKDSELFSDDDLAVAKTKPKGKAAKNSDDEDDGTKKDIQKKPKGKKKNRRHRKQTDPNKGERNFWIMTRQFKSAKERRGITSLVVALGIPILLLVPSVLIFGPDRATWELPSWFPRSSVYLLYFHFLTAPVALGVSSWFIWDFNGFAHKPMALFFYALYLVLGCAWNPIVFYMEQYWLGFVVSMGMYTCSAVLNKMFKRISHIAGYMVVHCILWAAYTSGTCLQFIYW